MRDAFLRAVQEMRDEAQIMAVARAIEAGRINDAILLANMSREFFDDFRRLIGDAYIAGGASALADLPALSDPFSPARGWWRALTAHRPAPKPGPGSTDRN